MQKYAQHWGGVEKKMSSKNYANNKRNSKAAFRKKLPLCKSQIKQEVAKKKRKGSQTEVAETENEI